MGSANILQSVNRSVKKGLIGQFARSHVRVIVQTCSVIICRSKSLGLRLTKWYQDDDDDLVAISLKWRFLLWKISTQNYHPISIQWGKRRIRPLNRFWEWLSSWRNDVPIVHLYHEMSIWPPNIMDCGQTTRFQSEERKKDADDLSFYAIVFACSDITFLLDVLNSWSSFPWYVCSPSCFCLVV